MYSRQGSLSIPWNQPGIGRAQGSSGCVRDSVQMFCVNLGIDQTAAAILGIDLILLLTLLIPFAASAAGRSNSSTTQQTLVGNMGLAPASAPASPAASNSSTSVVKVSEDIVKPACDKLSYRVVHLQNNLRVLLVHDPETEKGAAALDVSQAPWGLAWSSGNIAERPDVQLHGCQSTTARSCRSAVES